MEFILKACTFVLQLFDYGLNECFCHELILSPLSWRARRILGERTVIGWQFPFRVKSGSG